MIVKIQGGLGNQLFQYAYGRNLELSGKKVVFDTSFFDGNKSKNDTARDFKLNNFNIETKAEFSNRKRPLPNLIIKILEKLGLKKRSLYQSEKYFNNRKDIIKKEFTLKNKLSANGQIWREKIGMSENSVSIHIRRGDYVQNQKTKAFHGNSDLEYYKKALAEVLKQTKDQIDIFIFSDDISWAKQNLSFPHPTNFVSNPSIPDYEEMMLMSTCRHNIIANSTFSWWAAWLNSNPNKIVVAPKQWLKNKTSERLGILPKEWFKI